MHKLTQFPEQKLLETFSGLHRDLKVISIDAQTPFEMTFLNFLNHANHPAQILYRVRPGNDPSHLSPIALFSLLIAETGERKSSLDKAFNLPMRTFQWNLQEKYKEEVLKIKLRKAYAKRDNEAYVPDLIKQPLITTTTPTIEGIKKALSGGYHFHSVFSSEGAAFLNGHANLKENHLKTLSELSNFKDGNCSGEVRAGELTQEKIQNGEIFLGKNNISFSLFLSMQPYVFHNFISSVAVMRQGFLGRCLILTPSSLKGTRNIRSFIPQDEIDGAKKNIEHVLTRLYASIDTCEQDYKSFFIDEKDRKKFEQNWKYYEQFTTNDNPYSVGASFCDRRLEHVLSIASTLQAYRIARDNQIVDKEVQLDSDILELAWELFRFFYGQFVVNTMSHISISDNVIMPAVKQLPVETAKFLGYLKKSLKKQGETEKDEYLIDLKFTVNTAMFNGVSRVYEKKDAIALQIKCLVDEGFLEALGDKKFKFVDFDKCEDLNKFPDHNESILKEVPKDIEVIQETIEDIEYNPSISAWEEESEILEEYLCNPATDFYKEYIEDGWTLKALKSTQAIVLPRVKDKVVIDYRRLEELVEYMVYKKDLFSFEVRHADGFKTTTRYSLVPDLVDTNNKAAVKELYKEHAEKAKFLTNHNKIVKISEKQDRFDLDNFRKKFGI